MPVDILKLEDRKKLVDEMNGFENEERKAISLRQTEIYNDRLYQYVYEELRKMYGKDSVDETPVVATNNICRRIVNSQASLYKEGPRRTFTDLDDDQQDLVDKVYHDFMVDTKALMLNKGFCLQQQGHLMVVPKEGRLKIRYLRNHQLDVVPDEMDPEKGSIYIVSAFDKELYLADYKNRSTATGFRGASQRSFIGYSDRINQAIGDQDDYKENIMKYIVWTKDWNFIMNGKGKIISGDGQPTPNPLGMTPFVEVSYEKDNEFWVRQSEIKTDFTIEFNRLLSSMDQIVNINGFAQAVMFGKDVKAENLTIGPTKVLVMEPAIDEQGNVINSDFKFVNPNADISGLLEHAEKRLAMFLSSLGEDTSTITAGTASASFGSGIERLLAMIDRFESTKEDMARFQFMETQLWEIMKGWLNLSRDNELLLPKYRPRTEIPADSEISVEYKRPEMVETEDQRLNNVAKRQNLGLTSRIDEIEIYYDIDREEAIIKAEQIDEDERGSVGDGESEGAPTEQEQDQSEIQSEGDLQT